MKEFVNTYEYSREMVEETARAYYRYKIMPVRNILLCGVLLVLGCMLMAFHKNVMALLLGCGVLVSLAAMAVQAELRIAKIAQGLAESEEKNGTAEGTPMTSTFGGGECTIFAGRRKAEPMALSGLQDAFESRNYFVLMFEEQKIAAVRKDGFRKGSAGEFDAFFRTCPKQGSREAAELTGCLAALAGCSSYFLRAFC